MCNYCGSYPYGAYSPYQNFGYPSTYPSYPSYPGFGSYAGYGNYGNFGNYGNYASYGLPSGYAYAPSFASMAPPAYFAAPGIQRGEHKVGNCLMICQ